MRRCEGSAVGFLDCLQQALFSFPFLLLPCDSFLPLREGQITGHSPVQPRAPAMSRSHIPWTQTSAASRVCFIIKFFIIYFKHIPQPETRGLLQPACYLGVCC